eukprot:COSAG02_NODE_1309_length_13330_cov_61.652483_12_plen_89_part_00
MRFTVKSLSIIIVAFQLMTWIDSGPMLTAASHLTITHSIRSNRVGLLMRGQVSGYRDTSVLAIGSLSPRTGSSCHNGGLMCSSCGSKT